MMLKSLILILIVESCKMPYEEATVVRIAGIAEAGTPDESKELPARRLGGV